MNIIGTVKNSVKYAFMDHKWQEKKNQLGKNKQKELLPADRQLIHFQEQADAIRESQKPAGIDAKLASGAQLTPEEMEYLRRTNPQALKEYEKMQRIKTMRQSRNCPMF